MSGTTPGPWDKTAAAAPAPAAAAIKATDFLSAQRANKRNTWLLIVILLLLGGVLGYVGGALIESYSYSDYAYSDVERPSFAVLSAFGVIGGGALVSIGLVASAITFAFGGRLM